MNTIINFKKAQRLALLKELYNACEASPSVRMDALKVNEINLKLKFEDFQPAYYYLADEGFTGYNGSGFNVNITHKGIKAVETALGTPHQATGDFVAANDVDLLLRQGFQIYE